MKYSRHIELSQQAIEEYQFDDFDIINELTVTINWLEKYKKLFLAIILKPERVPLIIRPYCDDHQAIIDFFKLYEKLREGIITDKEIDSLNGY